MPRPTPRRVAPPRSRRLMHLRPMRRLFGQLLVQRIDRRAGLQPRIIHVARSASTSPYATSSTLNPPARSRYSTSTPIRIAPKLNGNANTANTPASTPAGPNADQRDLRRATRSDSSTGSMLAHASTHGPSPNSNCNSCTAATPGSETPARAAQLALDHQRYTRPSQRQQPTDAAHNRSSTDSASPSISAIAASTALSRSVATHPP